MTDTAKLRSALELEAQDIIERLGRSVHRGQFQIGGCSFSTDGKCTSWGGEKIMERANPDGHAAIALIQKLLARQALSELDSEGEGLIERLTRPMRIDNRTPEEVFDTMCDRIRLALSTTQGEGS